MPKPAVRLASIYPKGVLPSSHKNLLASPYMSTIHTWYLPHPRSVQEVSAASRPASEARLAGAGGGPPGSSWGAAKEQRKMKELQLELKLAEDRVAFLEASNTASSIVSPQS